MMKKCQNCGAQLEDTMKFCTECGQQIAGSENYSTEGEQFSKEREKRKNKKAVIIIILLAVALLTIAIIIVFFVPRKANLTLKDMKDMNELQIRFLLGKPDLESDNYLWYDNGRVKFYGVTIDIFTYTKDSHRISIVTNNPSDGLSLKSTIYTRCDLKSIGYVQGYSRYKYKDINISVMEGTKDYFYLCDVSFEFD